MSLPPPGHGVTRKGGRRYEVTRDSAKPPPRGQRDGGHSYVVAGGGGSKATPKVRGDKGPAHLFAPVTVASAGPLAAKKKPY